MKLNLVHKNLECKKEPEMCYNLKLMLLLYIHNFTLLNGQIHLSLTDGLSIRCVIPI